MRIHGKSNKLPALVTVIILLLAGVVAYFFLNPTSLPWANNSGDAADSATNKIDTSPPSNEQIDAGKDVKSNSVKNNQGDENNSKQAGTDETIDISAAATVNDGVVRVQTTIDKVTSTGTCTLTLKKGSETKKYGPVGVQALSSYSACKGFSVDGLSSGTWDITVTYTDSTVRGLTSTSVSL